MSRFGTHVPPPAEEYCCSDYQMLEARIGKTIGSDGRIKNPWKYDPYDAQSCYERAEKIGIVGEYLLKKRIAIVEKHMNDLEDATKRLVKMRDQL